MKSGRWQASTVITYLASLTTYLQFLRFMVDTQQEGYDYDVEKIEVLRKVILKWTKSLRKRRRILRSHKAIEKRKNPKVNPDDFRKYFQSEHVKRTKEMMAKKEVVVRATHSQVRNYTVYRLLAANGHRAGNLINATCEEFLRAEKNEKSNTHVMYILNHKTAGR